MVNHLTVNFATQDIGVCHQVARVPSSKGNQPILKPLTVLMSGPKKFFSGGLQQLQQSLRRYTGVPIFIQDTIRGEKARACSAKAAAPRFKTTL